MATFKRGGYAIEVEYITTLTNEREKVIKKNIICKCVIEIEDIKIVDYYLNIRGNVNLKKCRIFHEGSGWMVLNELYEEIKEIKMEGTFKVIGFQQTNKINKNVKRRNNPRSTRKNA